MGTLCGSGGGWTRLAYLDMTDATQICPSGFRLYQSGGVRACGKTNSSGGCVSVQFPSNGISYSQICGRVTGYQYHSPDAFATTGPVNIDSYYVDGVSITRGSPRQHVWSLANGITGSYAYVHVHQEAPRLSHILWETIISASLVIRLMVGLIYSTQLIHSGMVKVVVLLNHLVVMFLVSHGFTETIVTLPLLTLLS